MNAAIRDSGETRQFMHTGQSMRPRLLDCETKPIKELRIVLPLASNVAQGILDALAGHKYCSAVGRILCGGAVHLSYHRMTTTSDVHKPYNYGPAVSLDGYITFISGAITVGRDMSGSPLLHCHAGVVDRDGQHHGGHLALDRLVVGSEPLILHLCMFDHVTYQVQPDTETHFNLLHPVHQEAS